MAEDKELEIKILRIKAKITRRNRGECFRELFNWLAERRFREGKPDTEDEWTQVLSDEIAQCAYDIAMANGWIWEEQIHGYSVYSEYFHGPGVRATNERNRREAFRLPTVSDVTQTFWAGLILEWRARFLEEDVRASHQMPTKCVELTPNERTFRKKGDSWAIAFAQEETSVTHTVGMTYLAEVLRNPGRDIAAGQLIASAAGHPVEPWSSAGPLIDEKARKQYEARALELDREIKAARSRNDRLKTASLLKELEFVSNEVKAAKGLGGRRRHARDTGEKARKSVSQAINRALKKIQKRHPRLAEHLEKHLTLGVFVSYSGDGTPWNL